MSAWTKVVTHPLGLAGFALFLVFLYLARVKKGDKKPWLSPTAMVGAFVALVGGLLLAYAEVHSQPKTPVQGNAGTQAAPNQTNQVQQKTSGAGSPAIQGVQGDVTVTIDQSNGKDASQKPKNKKPKE